MSTIYSLTAFICFIGIIIYVTDNKFLKVLFNPFFSLVLLGLVLRILASKINISFQNDMDIFKYYANDLFENGFNNFYLRNLKSGINYQPLNLYILYFIGLIKNILGFKNDSKSFEMLIMLPSIAADITLGIFIYKQALKKMQPKLAYCLSLAFLINPAVILNSSIWGQMDSIFTLLIIFSLYYLTDEVQKNYSISFICFTLALLMKSQALIFTPIYIFASYNFVRDNRTSVHVKGFALSFFACLLLIIILIIPFALNFDFNFVYLQYFNIWGKDSYATINAYNFYALIGANWKQSTDIFLFLPYYIWGLLFICSIIILSLFLLKKRNSTFDYFFVAALLNTSYFMFFTKVHERYLYPSLVLFIITFIYKQEKRLLALFLGFSATYFINCTDIINMYGNGGSVDLIKESLPAVSSLNLLLILFLFAAIKKILFEEQTINTTDSSCDFPEESFQIERSVIHEKFNKKDLLLLGGVLTIYTFAAFINLGNLKSPQNFYLGSEGTTVTVDFGNYYNVKKIQYMNGVRDEKTFTISHSLDGIDFMMDKEIKNKSVFAWKEEDVDFKAKYIKITSKSNELYLNEMGFRDENHELVPITLKSENGAELFDEQDLVPTKYNYKNSTYFDEVYHARTAYEFIHKLRVYEWTHPPLGKSIISIGIRLFGMTPFGWRFMGTLFGCLMVPVIYLFAKRMFSNSYWATFATVVFSFDFMHYTQTRISTIDTYITIFVMLMYYFMYKYYTMSFYDTPFIKTLVPLFMSGLFMGIGIACKWPGVYAGAGLAVIFFYTIWKRYIEYKYAKTNNIAEITDIFYKYTTITLLCCVVFFVLIPVVTYGLSYIPFLNTPGTDGIKTIFKNQQDMLRYHADLESTHPFASQWWKWPLIIRPIYYYSNTFGQSEFLGIPTAIKAGISSFGNPAVWWTGIIAFFYAISLVSKKYCKISIFLLITFLSQYLPWVLVQRTTYIYHYFPSIPFIILMITLLFKEYVSKINKELVINLGYGRLIVPFHIQNFNTKLVIAYVALVVLLFVMFYPVITGIPVYEVYVKYILRWLPSWQII